MSKADKSSPLELSPQSVTGLYLATLASYGSLYWLLHYLWGSHFLTSFHVLFGRGFVLEGLGHVWFIFVWGIVATLTIQLVNRDVVYGRTRDLLGRAWWLSLNAGVFEELIYRWLQFGIATLAIPFINVITFGFEKWMYVQLLVPVADFMTLHQLHPYLVGHGSWVFGAAVLSSAVSFRDAHKHLGPVGMTNAWFLGMVFFWLVFHYGLMTAIVAHVVYDVLVFSTSIAVAERSKFELPWSLFGLNIGR